MSDQYKVAKSSPVNVEYRPARGRTGVSKTYAGAVGINEDKTIFGLCGYANPDYLTHMAYALDGYFVPSGVIARDRGDDPYFYFQGGGMGYPIIRVSISDLESAFMELGLL